MIDGFPLPAFSFVNPAQHIETSGVDISVIVSACRKGNDSFVCLLSLVRIPGLVLD